MENDRINSFQFMALAFLCTLSPMIHTIPTSVSAIAGNRAWISCCIAFLPGILLCGLSASVIRLTRGGSLCKIIRLNFGDCAGRLLCAAFFLWLSFLAGFILRAEGQRFVSTAYPLADPKIFAAASLILCIPAVLGKLKSIARTAMLLRPVLAVVLVTVFVSALPGISLQGLWQPGRDELGQICLGSIPSAEPLCFSIYILFFAHRIDDTPCAAQYAGLLIASIGTAVLLAITVLGSFGTELCSQIYAPFFSMVRDLELFGDVDRIEAVVTAVWVFSDFVVTSVLISAAAECLENAIPAISGNRFCPLIPCIGALGTGLFLAPTSRALERFTEDFVPIGNLVVLCITVLTVIAAQRRKTNFG